MSMDRFCDIFDNVTRIICACYVVYETFLRGLISSRRMNRFFLPLTVLIEETNQLAPVDCFLFMVAVSDVKLTLHSIFSLLASIQEDGTNALFPLRYVIRVFFIASIPSYKTKPVCRERDTQSI